MKALQTAMHSPDWRMDKFGRAIFHKDNYHVIVGTVIDEAGHIKGTGNIFKNDKMFNK
jgi:hypothetical protein